jgi:L,D-transpeptidase ErfK/SrfK
MQKPLLNHQRHSIFVISVSLGVWSAFLIGSGAVVAAEQIDTTGTLGIDRSQKSVITTQAIELPKLGEAGVYLPIETTTRLVVRLSKRRVYVYDGDQEINSYPIAVGKAGWATPAGDFKVFLKEENPIFKSFKSGRIIPPGPDNPLGVRWIGIWTDGKTQLGFHGTNEPELIGQAVSHGCIRMFNKDVVALYKQVALGTPVKIVP